MQEGKPGLSRDLGFSQYFSNIYPLPNWLIVLVLGALIIYVNYRGAKLSGRVEVFVVALLLLLLLSFSLVGVFNVRSENLSPFLPEGFGVVIGTIGLIIVSYTGFEKIATIAEELKNPGRVLPLSVQGSTSLHTGYRGTFHPAGSVRTSDHTGRD